MADSCKGLSLIDVFDNERVALLFLILIGKEPTAEEFAYFKEHYDTTL